MGPVMLPRWATAASLLFCHSLWSACLATPPEQEEPAVQGDYEDGDEEHRPGQPCLLCHGETIFVPPPGPDFETAGTVYGGDSDPEDSGIEGVDVIITDAMGREIVAVTNRAGNFMVEVSSDVNEPTQRDKGRLLIPWELEFPLSVRIRMGEIEQEMETKIWREGSCAHCHGPEPGADSVGRVYLYDEGEQP